MNILVLTLILLPMELSLGSPINHHSCTTTTTTTTTSTPSSSSGAYSGSVIAIPDTQTESTMGWTWPIPSCIDGEYTSCPTPPPSLSPSPSFADTPLQTTPPRPRNAHLSCSSFWLNQPGLPPPGIPEYSSSAPPSSSSSSSSSSLPLLLPEKSTPDHYFPYHLVAACAPSDADVDPPDSDPGEGGGMPEIDSATSINLDYCIENSRGHVEWMAPREDGSLLSGPGGAPRGNFSATCAGCVLYTGGTEDETGMAEVLDLECFCFDGWGDGEGVKRFTWLDLRQGIGNLDGELVC
ncbi:hypothetical protein MKZ38_005043 [Zalerion maritima]|uniref:Cyanovirin-N domain-containing protein n=1 Tax=Zalerion maritima TaxID=339359 RepID=A0AAD5WPI5_9PEZI|nr:hypothetical protein MKZ38_005043 [Zalerion maritima]